MVKLLALKSPEGRTIVAPAYYGSRRHGSLQGANYVKVSDWRSGTPVIHYQRHHQHILQVPELSHLLKVATDIVSPTIAVDSLALETVNPIVIDAQPLITGDLVEIRSAQAATLKISAGTWQATSDRRLVLTNPPVYQLTSAWQMGVTPWSFRILSGGRLQGLGVLTRANVAATQKNAGAATTNPARFGGGLWQNVGMTSATWQGFRVSFDELTVRKIAMRVTSQKQNYDTKFPIAQFSINVSDQGDASWFYNYQTGVRQSAGMATWSSGAEQYWITQSWETAKKISWFGTNDEGMSRAICAAELYGDVPCQMKIGNDYPPPGATVVIPESIADDTFPKITAGKYTVIKNDAESQWELAPQ